MGIYGAKFQEQFQRYRLFSFYHFSVAVVWHHHWCNLHNRKSLISLKRKKIFQKEKRQSFLCHIHLNVLLISSTILHVKRFSKEVRTSKTKVISLTSYKGHNQYTEPIKIQSLHVADAKSAGKACERIRIGSVGFSSKWLVLIRLVLSQCCNVTRQSKLRFDTQVTTSRLPASILLLSVKLLSQITKHDNMDSQSK